MSTNPREVIHTELPRVPSVRLVKQGERKPEKDDKVELLKVRRELLTLANRIDTLIKGQD